MADGMETPHDGGTTGTWRPGRHPSEGASPDGSPVPPFGTAIPAIPAQRGPGPWVPPAGAGTSPGGWAAGPPGTHVPPGPRTPPGRSLRSNPLAIAGAVLGGVGLLLGLIPLVGLAASPLAIGGLVLALIGLVRSERLGGRALAVTGVVVSVVALVMVTAATSLFVAGYSRGVSAAANPTPTVASPRTSSLPGFVAPEVASAPLGTAISYPNGLVVTVTGPAPYTPSTYAADRAGSRPFAVQVTVRNGTSESFTPNSALTSASVGGVEAEAVYDSTNGVSGPPSTTVLPGRSVTFVLAFAAPPRPGDLVVDVRPGYRAEAATFTGRW